MTMTITTDSKQTESGEPIPKETLTQLRGGGGGGERAQNSELYYTRIKILSSCLLLQSVPANLHTNRLHIKQ